MRTLYPLTVNAENVYFGTFVQRKEVFVLPAARS